MTAAKNFFFSNRLDFIGRTTWIALFIFAFIIHNEVVHWRRRNLTKTVFELLFSFNNNSFYKAYLSNGLYKRVVRLGRRKFLFLIDNSSTVIMFQSAAWAFLNTFTMFFTITFLTSSKLDFATVLHFVNFCKARH